MNKVAPIIAEEIELFHIDILKSDLKETGKITNPDYNLNVAHKTSHNLKDERVRIKLLIHLSNEQKGIGKNEADFEIDFHFKIQNLYNFYSLNEEKKTPIFSAHLIATLLGISFSTVRGILLERFANTNFKGVILPVVAPGKMLQTKIES